MVNYMKTRKIRIIKRKDVRPSKNAKKNNKHEIRRELKEEGDEMEG